MKKKILSAALLSMLVSPALGAVTAGAVYEMDEVTVTADREGIVAALPGGLVNQTAKLGILGNKSVMDIPYSEMSMTEKTLETFSDPSQPLANVLQNNPSIRSSTSSPMYTDFSMRGINMNGNHMMLNGIPSLFYQFNGPPNHIIERMDITSGPMPASMESACQIMEPTVAPRLLREPSILLQKKRGRLLFSTIRKPFREEATLASLLM